jgi:dolichol-phosphate mannosyltransferase
LSLIIAVSFYYIAIGLPGAGPMSGNRLFGEWQLVSERVAAIDEKVEHETGSTPVVIATDRNFISSELSFYNEGALRKIGGSDLVGSRSLMWAYWFPRSAALGRNLLMVDLNRQNLENSYFPAYFDKLGEIYSEPLIKRGRMIGHVYWRVGYRYKGA